MFVNPVLTIRVVLRIANGIKTKIAFSQEFIAGQVMLIRKSLKHDN